MPSQFVDLGQQGLSNGDFIDPYIEDHWNDDTEVYIPPGDYETDLNWVSTSVHEAHLIGDEAGVSFHRASSPPTGSGGDIGYGTLNYSGHCVIENINLHYPLGQPRERPLSLEGANSSAVLEFRNVNWPERSLGCGDSYYGRLYNDGNVIFRWCHFDAVPNAAFYMLGSATGNASAEYDGCVFHNTRDTLRGGTRDFTVRNCLLYHDGPTPDWAEGGSGSDPFSSGCNSNSGNMFKMDQSYSYSGHFENLHFVFTGDSPGINNGIMDFRDEQPNTSGTMDDFYIYNDVESSSERRQFDHHTGRNLGGWNIGDVHITGAWGTDSINMSGVSANVVSNPDQPVMELPPVWTPGGVGLPTRLGGGAECESDSECPDGFICRSGRCELAVPDEFADFLVQSERGAPEDGQRSEFFYRVVVEGYLAEAVESSNATVSIINEDPLRMEATGETGNHFNDHYEVNGTIIEAVVTGMDEEDNDLDPVSPGDGMIWVIDGVRVVDPSGMTVPGDDLDPVPDIPPRPSDDCQEMIDAADSWAIDVQAAGNDCPSTGVQLQCPTDPGVTVSAGNDCTEEALREYGWAEPERPGPPQPANDTCQGHTNAAQDHSANVRSAGFACQASGAELQCPDDPSVTYTVADACEEEALREYGWEEPSDRPAPPTPATDSCEAHLSAASDHVTNVANAGYNCSGEQVELVCPFGEGVSHMAQNGCETEALKEYGWTEVEGGSRSGLAGLALVGGLAGLLYAGSRYLRNRR